MRLGGRRPDFLAREFQRFIHDGPLLGPQGHAELLPGVLFILRRSFQVCSQSPDGLRPRPLHPEGLRLPSRHRQHGPGLPRADLPAAHRLAQERPIPQPPRQPLHLHRRAGVDPQDLAGVVADVRVAEIHRPIAHRQRREPFSDGELHRSPASGQRGQHRVDQVGGLAADGLVPLPGHRPGEHPGDTGERVEPGSVREIRRWIDRDKGFGHVRIVPTPSDTSGWPGQPDLGLIRGLGRDRRFQRADRSGDQSAPGGLLDRPTPRAPVPRTPAAPSPRPPRGPGR